MKKLFTITMMVFTLSGCEYFGNTRTKNLIDLTPKLKEESAGKVNFSKQKVANLNNVEFASVQIAKTQVISDPIVVKGIMYVVDNRGNISAYDKQNKQVIWQSMLLNNVLDFNISIATVTHHDGKLFVTNGSRFVIVLDAKTGEEIIRKEFMDVIKLKIAVIDTDNMLVQTVSNQLISFNSSNFKTNWLREDGDGDVISTALNSSPLAYNGKLLVSYSSGLVIYLNAKTGEVLWRYSLTDIVDVGLPGFEIATIIHKPMIDNNYVYFATSNGKLIKIDLDNGAAVWVKRAEDILSIRLMGNHIFITNNARQAAAFSTHNGKIEWVGDLISEKERGYKHPKAISFHQPFVSEVAGKKYFTVIGSNGELYQFALLGSGNLSKQPIITKIVSKTDKQWLCCCSCSLHLIKNNTLLYIK